MASFIKTVSVLSEIYRSLSMDRRENFPGLFGVHPLTGYHIMPCLSAYLRQSVANFFAHGAFDGATNGQSYTLGRFRTYKLSNPV